MITKLVNWITFALFSFHKPNRTFWVVRKTLFLFPFFSILLVASVNYYSVYKFLTQSALERRQAIVHFAGVALKERFDRITEVGVSLASRLQFRALIQEGKWDEALQILKNAPENFPYIDRIFLADPKGVEMADMPHLEGTVGKDFAYRDWYKGVTKAWKPYVSEVYKRAITLDNIVTAAIPIKADDGSVLGVLVIQIKADVFAEWSRSTYTAPAGFLYFVDQKGHVVAHPKFSPEKDIVDFSSVPVVQRLLKGEAGVDVAYNPMEKEVRVVAFERVPGYGWGIVLQEPTRTAFKFRNYTLFCLIGAYGLILLLNYFLIVFILKIFEVTQEHRQKLLESQQRMSAVLETAQDAIVSADSKGNIIGWNKAAEAIFGYKESEVMGKPLTVIMPARYHDPHLQGLQRFLKTKDPRVIGRVAKLSGARKNGVEFPLELSLSTWTAEGELFFTAIIRDITWDTYRNPKV